MEDYILREIDRIGEMLMKIARKMGLFLDDVPKYSISDAQAEFERADCTIDLDSLLNQEFPVQFLVQEKGLSVQALELIVDIIFHSDAEESKKVSLLNDALSYLDGKGYYSFKLHSLS
ncbi:MAG: hypothetical protein J6W09_02750 [Bacteroidales bacterium]|nr:hypothetical protein [Bacteroidales bacterium]